MKYYVMRPYRDEYNILRWTRESMRALTLNTAKRTADRVRGYVCRLGTTDPVYIAPGA